jgi:putative transposase
MKRSRFSVQQIVGVLEQAEAGVPVNEFCRKHGISDATFYINWKAKYGGMGASDLKRLKELAVVRGKVRSRRRLRVAGPQRSGAASHRCIAPGVSARIRGEGEAGRIADGIDRH